MILAGGVYSVVRLITSVLQSAANGLRTPWYCGRVNSGRERMFERMLRRFGIQTYLPVTTRTVRYEHRDDRDRVLWRKNIERECPLFPGYVFAALDDYAWARTRSVEVARKPQWLDFGSGPVEIPLDLITELREREEKGFIQTIEEADGYREGDELDITCGPYKGWRGILASDPDRRILTLHMIAESYSLQPALVRKRVKIEREYTKPAGNLR